MDSKLSQKGWQNVVIWVGLLAATAFTSNAMTSIFFNLIDALIRTLGEEGIASLFSAPNLDVLFALILGIGLIFLLVMAWLNVVSYTFDITDIVFEAEEEVEDSIYPASVVRYLAFTWGLFFILLLTLSFVI